MHCWTKVATRKLRVVAVDEVSATRTLSMHCVIRTPSQITLAVLVSGWAHVLHAMYKPWGAGTVMYALQHGSLFVTSFVFLMVRAISVVVADDFSSVLRVRHARRELVGYRWTRPSRPYLIYLSLFYLTSHCCVPVVHGIVMVVTPTLHVYHRVCCSR